MPTRARGLRGRFRKAAWVVDRGRREDPGGPVDEAIPVDLAVSFYERDRDTFARCSAAIALRLFLFIVPAIVTGVGQLLTVAGHDAIDTTSRGP
jgi:hypothetical protein